MLKYGNHTWEDEAALRKALDNGYTANGLRGGDWLRNGIFGVQWNIVRDYSNLSSWRNAKKVDLVDEYVKFFMEQSVEVKIPETFEELQEAVIRETMAYDGCYSGKKGWLASVGLTAPPPPHPR